MHWRHTNSAGSSNLGDTLIYDLITEQYTGILSRYNPRKGCRKGNRPAIPRIFTTIGSSLHCYEIVMGVLSWCRITFFHYISVMQSKEIPLLFSFNEKELALLQDDDFLAPYARAEARELHEVWGIVAEPMKVLLTNNVGWNHSRCLSLPLYKKFYTLAVSRAMFLDDAFYLVPMADCINHRHHPDVFSTSRERGCNHSKETQTSIFPRYHHRDLKTGSISVRADRDVQAGNQLYEEYDRMDNTGHLVHFGFVLRDNPFHCVVLDFLPFLGVSH